MNEHFEPTRFTRNNRFIHALILDAQAWFSVVDLGRLMGYSLNERLIRKLDTDQYRVLSLNYHGEIQDTLMVSESGMYALMIYHQIPENRNLRQWLTHDVIPALRRTTASTAENGPTLTTLHWAGRSVSLLHWQNTAWIQWRDMPMLMPSVEHANGLSR
ncbi:phage antirepressor protein [Pseudomonas sp. FFUP_PS_473]|uniref:BRO-N domain-containing protein n=1 Tax=Pseudomonas sp. FFUP_PS_473 TaxID=2060418 RepID=UPI000C7A87B9|nr:Bro-N domain-containing protein [Pseudomonas sp. FFUP_PS_473]PLP95758.1 phage antirepressor protein [Pseudomonas sp. FFUP_PS_473]